MNAREEMEITMEATVRCKIGKSQSKETRDKPDIRKSKYACIVVAKGSTRKRLEGTQQKKKHEDLMAGKVCTSLSH